MENIVRSAAVEQPSPSGETGAVSPSIFSMALAREIAVAHNGPLYWINMNDTGRDYWRKRVERNIGDARQAIAEGVAPGLTHSRSMDEEEARARAAACATWHELKAQEYRRASKGEHASTHEEWCEAIRTTLVASTGSPPVQSDGEGEARSAEPTEPPPTPTPTVSPSGALMAGDSL